MRKTSILLIIALALIATTLFTGCGCSDGSDRSDNQGNTTNQTTANNNQTPSANSSKSGTGSESTQHKDVKSESYINGKNFDLTSYAEALGYTWLQDPDSGKVVMYSLERDGAKYFFSYDGSMLYLFIDLKDNSVYKTHPLSCPSSSDGYTVISKGQTNRIVSEEGLKSISKIMEYVATTNSIEIDKLPCFGAVDKHSGSAKYFSNGLIQYNNLGAVEETIICHGEQ